jgi:hypothetical protein
MAWIAQRAHHLHGGQTSPDVPHRVEIRFWLEILRSSAAPTGKARNQKVLVGILPIVPQPDDPRPDATTYRQKQDGPKKNQGADGMAWRLLLEVRHRYADEMAFHRQQGDPFAAERVCPRLRAVHRQIETVLRRRRTPFCLNPSNHLDHLDDPDHRFVVGTACRLAWACLNARRAACLLPVQS